MKRMFLISLFLIFITGFGKISAQEIFGASKSGDLENVKRLIEKDQALVNSKDQFGRTPLHWAARGVHFELMKYLIEKGADINAVDGYAGVTPLHSVASRGHAEAVKLLLDKGANKETQSKFVFSRPLHYAALSGNEEVVKIMLDYGANFMAKDVNEKTPLFYACEAGKTEVAGILADKMIATDTRTIDIVDFDGNTPLHSAASNGFIEIIKILVKKGAGINCRNAVGESPYNLAVKENKKDVADYLLSEGASASSQKMSLLKGQYLGQQEPEMTPVLFAKGIISTQQGMHGTIVFSPDMSEAFWKTDGSDVLQFIRKENGSWKAPEKFLFKEKWWIDAPCYSFDGKKLFFMAGAKDEDDMITKENIYFCERKGETWSEPQLFDSLVNSVPMHFQFSFDRKGNFYTGGRDIYCSVYENGRYKKPEKLPPVINTSAGEGGPFISPDGDYLIFNRVTPPPAFSSKFLISFKDSKGSWGEPIDLGPLLKGGGSIARLTPDGKYLFFQSDRPGSPSNRGLYWVSVKIIEKIRPPR